MGLPYFFSSFFGPQIVSSPLPAPQTNLSYVGPYQHYQRATLDNIIDPTIASHSVPFDPTHHRLPSPHVGFFHHHHSRASAVRILSVPCHLPLLPRGNRTESHINGVLVYHKFPRKILSALVFLYSQIYPNLNLDSQRYLDLPMVEY